MTQPIPCVNQTAELADCREQWVLNDAYGCWCLEDVLYTQRACAPAFQCLSIFVPRPYLTAGGVVDPQGKAGRFTARTAPVVFENACAGYMQMPHTWLDGPHDEAGKYLARGMVYVTCGCRGRDSRDSQGRLCGKSPWTLVDLKTAIRFLRHNAAALPGDFERIVSVGCSAGGAMSALLALTGGNRGYFPLLERNGAFMDTSDHVYAAQVYCPITDLDHADLAYEWQFQNDQEILSSAGDEAAFLSALSKELTGRYVDYFNSLGLMEPATGEPLTLGADGRSGSGYRHLMSLLEDSATDFLTRLEQGALPLKCSVEEYLQGRYTWQVPMRPNMHPGAGGTRPTAHVFHSPHGIPYELRDIPMGEAPGNDKRAWLSWDGRRACITSLDDYLLHHCRRMKPCTSFDALRMNSGENQEFGTPERDSMHFSPQIAPAVLALKPQFPEAYARYYSAYAKAGQDQELAWRRRMLNPMHFIGAERENRCASRFRIRVGACDADTAFIISMVLALKLVEAGKAVDFAFVWDRPHCQADYPDEVCDWIEKICLEPPERESL